jgi:hypothetical protein
MIFSAEEELAFCNRMACHLTRISDLPRLCQGFPTVVDAVNRHHMLEHQQQQQQHHHEEQHHDAGMMEMSGTENFFVPPPSDR